MAHSTKAAAGRRAVRGKQMAKEHKPLIVTTHMEDGWIAEAVKAAQTDDEDTIYSTGFCETEDEAVKDAKRWLKNYIAK